MVSSQPREWRSVLSARFGRSIGLAALTAGLSLYTSYTNRPILERWSYGFFAVLLATAMACLASFACSFNRLRGKKSPEKETEGAARLLDLAFMVWGLAYLLGSLESPKTAGRLVELVFLGAIQPVPMALEWVGLLLVFLSAGNISWRIIGRRLPAAFLAVAAVLTVALLGEGIARLQAILFPETQGFPTSSERAWSLRYVRLNQQGFRDRDHTFASPKGVRRLLVIGDSFAFGFGIDNLESRFGEMLAELLRKYTGEPWEVITAARGDTHSLDHIGFLMQTIDYKPDVVILEYVFNDIDYLVPMTVRDSVVESEPGVLSKLRPGRVLFINSLLYQQIYIRIRHLRYNSGKNPIEKIDPYEDVSILQRHVKDLRRFEDIAETSGALFAIVPFDHRVATQEIFRRRYRTFVENASAAGLRVWPIDSVFLGQDFSKLVVNPMDRHPNRKANLLVAEAVYPKIISNLAIRNAKSR